MASYGSEEGGLGKRTAEGGGGHEGGNKRPHTDVSDKPHAIKLLVSNKDAGTVIGRGGQTISTMQSKSGSRIRVSNANDYFPGTQERVVLVSGEVPQVAEGAKLVLREVYQNAESLQNNPDAAPQDSIVLKLVIPNAAAGVVIGKGGENIRKMVADSGAKIQLSSKEQQVPGVDERILTVTGDIEQLVMATGLAVEKVCEDPSVRFSNMTTNYTRHAASAFGRGPPPGGAYGMPPYGQPYAPYGADPYAAYGQPPGGYGGYAAPPSYDQYPPAYPPAQPAYGAQSYDAYGQQAAAYGAYGQAAPAAAAAPGAGAGGNVTYTLYVADHVVPAILGRGGAVIKEFMEQSGATIKVSQKGEYAPGSTNRVVTITGSQTAASYAHQLVSAKVPAM